MFSEPVIGEKFFGRGEVLELLNKRVAALKDGYRQNIALTGTSLVGKSSVILHFLYMIREEGFVPVYVEVVKEPFASFANKFVATLLYNALSKKGEEVGIDMPRLLERSREAFPKTSSAIKNINNFLEDGKTDDAYSNLLALTSILKEESGLNCIVILDEFDNLENLGIRNPFLTFGKVIMVQKDTMYVVSSSRNRVIKKIISEKLSLLFGNFEVVRIANFDPATAADFIDTKFSGFDLDHSLKKFLVAFTDGNPFYLDRITRRAREIAMERMSTYIDIDTVIGSILELVYDANGVIHQYLLNFLLSILDTKNRELHISVLSAMADGRLKNQEIARTLKIKQADVSKSLDSLLELGLVSKNGVFHRIDDAVLSFWLKNVYQRRRALLIDGTFDKMSLFREEMATYISAMLQEFDRDLPQRIAELFNIFSNELVQIESKSMRLPHFTKVEVKSPGDRPLVSASFRGSYWIAAPLAAPAGENDIINFVRDMKALGHKIANKIILPVRGIDENARLLAKELKISIWDLNTINTLFQMYGKERIVPL